MPLPRQLSLVLIAALSGVALSCGSTPPEVSIPPLQVDDNGRFVVPTLLLDEYALFEGAGAPGEAMLPGTPDLRKAHVYHQFNARGDLRLDSLELDLLAAQAGQNAVLADRLAQEIGGVIEGEGSFHAGSSGPSYEAYLVSFGGDISLNRLFLNATYVVDNCLDELYAVRPQWVISLPDQ